MLVDGNRVPMLRMPVHAVVKGDAKVQAIAAASILAKVHRDRLCLRLHYRYPQYGFATHKGYPTPGAPDGVARPRRLRGAPPQLCTGACARLGAMTVEALHIRSRDNPALVAVRRALREPASYRRKGAPSWLEGDHLLRACLARGHPLMQVLLTESAWGQPSLRDLAHQAARVLILPDVLFKELSSLESPASIGALIERPQAPSLRTNVPTVILDRLQDAGNAGSILRSAAAFGVTQVLALSGTAALWSPKVLRAAMGAHFALQLHEAMTVQDLSPLTLPWLATSSHATALLHEAKLPQPCAWVFGHEGQGVSAELVERCTLTLRIAQPGGEESLNVAAAAAICLHEGLRQRC